jgi:trehalose 6-phosphate synthase
VNPFNIEQQADALYKALVMDSVERRVRAEHVRQIVEGNSIEKWVAAQFADIDRKLTADGPRRSSDG